MKINDDVKKAYELAKEARLRAHAPYSHYLVGACFKLKNQENFIVGCNVENASYGATICAERAALTSMVSQLGKQEVEFAILVTESKPAAPPCGMCLQVMNEFCEKSTPIYLSNLKEIEREVLFEKLLLITFEL